MFWLRRRMILRGKIEKIDRMDHCSKETNFMESIMMNFWFFLLLANFPMQYALAEEKKIAKDIYDFDRDDRKILENGEIGAARHIIGAVFAINPGFGIGHAIQGRYSQTGWYFTAGELGSIALGATGILGGYGSSYNGALFIVGFFGFKIWEIVDGIGGPFWDNSRYQYLHNRYNISNAVRFKIMPVPLARLDAAGKSRPSVGLGMQWDLD
jgi:hypothetical protein